MGGEFRERRDLSQLSKEQTLRYRDHREHWYRRRQFHQEIHETKSLEHIELRHRGGGYMGQSKAWLR